jgi:hypothetical protein
VYAGAATPRWSPWCRRNHAGYAGTLPVSTSRRIQACMQSSSSRALGQCSCPEATAFWAGTCSACTGSEHAPAMTSATVSLGVGCPAPSLPAVAPPWHRHSPPHAPWRWPRALPPWPGGGPRRPQQRPRAAGAPAGACERAPIRRSRHASHARQPAPHAREAARCAPWRRPRRTARSSPGFLLLLCLTPPLPSGCPCIDTGLHGARGAKVIPVNCAA